MNNIFKDPSEYAVEIVACFLGNAPAALEAYETEMRLSKRSTVPTAPVLYMNEVYRQLTKLNS